MEQGSAEWRQARVGKVTASRMSDLMAKTKTGYGASRANLMAELLVERLTGQPAESYINATMQWGIDHEDEARVAYEFYRDVVVEKTGFIVHPEIEESGASPDGLVDIDGLVEIKAPNTATHVETLITDSVPSKYVLQIQWQMACTGRQWCDFVSYDPRLPEHLRLYVKRVPFDITRVGDMKSEVMKFLEELNQKVHVLTALRAA